MQVQSARLSAAAALAVLTDQDKGGKKDRLDRGYHRRENHERRIERRYARDDTGIGQDPPAV